jgi:hypothetical protein
MSSTVIQNFLLFDSCGTENGKVAVDVHADDEGWTGMLYFNTDLPLSNQVRYSIEHLTLGAFTIKAIESTKTTSRMAEFVGYWQPPRQQYAA